MGLWAGSGICGEAYEAIGSIRNILGGIWDCEQGQEYVGKHMGLWAGSRIHGETYGAVGRVRDII